MKKFLHLFSCWCFKNTKSVKISEVITEQEFEEVPFYIESPFIVQAPVFEQAPFVLEREFYQPSSESTWEAYQALIALVEAQSQTNLPQVVLCGVAEEVLSVLKNHNTTTPNAKKAEIEKILNPIPDFVFNQLVSISKQVTDYDDDEDQVVPFASEKDFYQPKSEETRTAYKLLLDMVNDEIPVVLSQIQQCVVAHKVLVVLKDEMMEKKKKRGVLASGLNRRISDDTFDMFLFIGELIKDFGDGNDYLHQRDSVGQSQRCQREEVEGVDDFTDDDEPVNPIVGDV